jgi:hypothetical protein
MFYPLEPPRATPGKKQAAALVVLNPAQSRRLVAKGAVAMPDEYRIADPVQYNYDAQAQLDVLGGL